MRKKAFMRRIALLVSLLVLMTSTIQTTYGFIVVMTDPVINTFMPEEVMSGDLVITKEVEHKMGPGYMVPSDDEFTFKVELKSSSFSYKETSLKVYDGSVMSLVKTDEDGVLTVKVKGGQSVMIGGIDKGTEAVITEILTGLDTYTVKGKDTKKVIIDEDGEEVIFTNIYDPGSVPSVTVPVTVTKVMSYGPGAGSFDPEGKFEFVLHEEGASAGASQYVGEDGKVHFNLMFTEADAGEHTFILSETDNDIPDVEYDVEYVSASGEEHLTRVFTVLVEKPAYAGGTPTVKINGEENAEGFAATYVNKYSGTSHVGAQASVKVKVTKNVINLGSDKLSPEGFRFVLEDITDLSTVQQEQPLVQGPVDGNGDPAGQQPVEQQPVEEPAEQPAETPAETPAEEQPVEEPAEEQPVEEPAEEPAEQSAEEPAETPAEEQPAEEPAETPVEEQPVEEPAEQPAEQQPVEEPAEQPDNQQSEEPAEEPEAGDFVRAPFTREVPNPKVFESDEVGKAQFVLEYTTADIGKTYTYKLREINDGRSYVEYDESEFIFTVTVTKNGAGEMITLVDGEEAKSFSGEFNNIYDYTPSPGPGPTPPDPELPEEVVVPIKVIKNVVESGTVKLTKEGYEFVLNNLTTGQKTVRTSDENGQATFYLTFSENEIGKTFNFQLTETVPEGAVRGIFNNILYDSTVYDIQVEVVSQGGMLKAVVTIDGVENNETIKKLSFTNVEMSGVEDISFTVKAHKTVMNTGDEEIGPEEFMLILKQVDENGDKIGKTQSDRTNKKGNASFQLPAFSAEDAGKIFRYQIYEKDEGMEGVTYDKTVHEFAVQVRMTEDNKLEAALLLPVSVAEAYAKSADNEDLKAAISDLKAAADKSGAAEIQWVDMTEFGWKAEFVNTYDAEYGMGSGEDDEQLSGKGEGAGEGAGSEDSPASGVPKTSDESNVELWFTIMLISLFTTIWLLIAERRSYK